MSVVGEPAPTKKVLDPLSRRVVKEGRAYRPLRPIEAKEAELFQAVLRGEHTLNGFRNRDIRELMAPGLKPQSVQGRALTGRITRTLGLLRPRSIRKVQGQTRYRVKLKQHDRMTRR